MNGKCTCICSNFQYLATMNRSDHRNAPSESTSTIGHGTLILGEFNTASLAGPMKASPRGWRNKLVKAATKKVILGIDSEICGTRHMKFLAKRYGVKVHTSMEGCLANKHNLK